MPLAVGALLGQNVRVVRPLGRAMDRATFDCGRPVLNEWLRTRAGQFERKGLARTFFGLRPGDSKVLGYYAISNHHVAYEALPGEQAAGLPRIAVPVVLCLDK